MWSIDRNTGGIVIAAKNAETLRIINEKIKNHELEKSYLCVTVGHPRPAEGRIEGFLLKDEAKKQVSFYHKPVPGGKTAVTLYKTLESRGPLSLVECRLLTGRTHQIRVSMAEIGCPLLGDGKYGQGALVNNGDVCVLHIQPFQGFQNRCLDLTAVLVHDAAAQVERDAFTRLHSDHAVAGFQCSGCRGFENFHCASSICFLLFYPEASVL